MGEIKKSISGRGNCLFYYIYSTSWEHSVPFEKKLGNKLTPVIQVEKVSLFLHYLKYIVHMSKLLQLCPSIPRVPHDA